MTDTTDNNVVKLTKRHRANLEADPSVPPEFSEDALAAAFTEAHGGELRYVQVWGRWMRWNGMHWAAEATALAFDLARAICRAAAAEARRKNGGDAGERVAVKLAAARTVAAVERLARADRTHAATADDWDANPWLLAAQDQTVDLRTGDRRPPRPDDYSTRTAAVAPGGDCPLWLRFLDRIMGGDREMIGYLQRLAGYCLTGDTSEHAMFFGYGTGANGKSVLMNTVAGVLGDYATTAPVEVFTEARGGDRHPTELAMLRGARLVTATETEQGHHWNESRIKALTGGDPITARFMRMDFFTFKPAFKLLISGNHRPPLRGVDEAIKRRLHLLPFNVTIPPAERDPALMDKLKLEWPGILQWMLDGTAAWRERGLDPPATVQEATADYLASEDSFATWLGDCTEPAADWAFEAGADLYASFRKWSERAGERGLTMKAFTQELERRGYARSMNATRTARGFIGIRLQRADYTDDPRSGG